MYGNEQLVFKKGKNAEIFIKINVWIFKKYGNKELNFQEGRKC